MGEVIRPRGGFGGSKTPFRVGLEGAVVDLSTDFDARRQAATLELYLSERDLIYHIIHKEVSDFHRVISSHSQPVGRALYKAYGDKVEARRITAKELEVKDGIKVAKSVPFGTYPKIHESGARQTVMYLPIPTIKAVHRRFSEFYSRDRYMSRRTKYEASITAATWMMLGSWVIKTLDPRTIMGSTGDSRIADEALEKLLGERVHAGPREVIDGMQGVRQAFAGSLAYTGMREFMRANEVEACRDKVGWYENRTRALYDNGLTSNDEVDFILGRPMNRTQTKEVITILEPVASEMLKHKMFDVSALPTVQHLAPTMPRH